MGGNNIGDQGATTIANAIAVNADVTELYLGGNSIGAAATAELRAVASARPSLTIYGV